MAYYHKNKTLWVQVIIVSLPIFPKPVVPVLAMSVVGTTISTEELALAANEYKKLAGFDLAHLQALAKPS